MDSVQAGLPGAGAPPPADAHVALFGPGLAILERLTKRRGRAARMLLDRLVEEAGGDPGPVNAALLEAMDLLPDDAEEWLASAVRQKCRPRKASNGGGHVGAEDPFAPLTDEERSRATKAKPDDEVWEPLPAPGEPPEAGQVRHGKFGTATRRWVYRDAAGAVLFLVVRFDIVQSDGSTKKEMLPYSFGRRAWTTKAGNRRDVTGWHFKRVPAPVPLYGLDRLAGRPDAPVLLVEGEKAADAAAGLFPDLVAISAQGGSENAGKADWAPLAGRTVTIWPDRDAAGLKFARKAAAGIVAAGASAVHQVEVPEEWPEGWDVADPLPEGVTPEGLAEMISDAAAGLAPGASAADVTEDYRSAEIDRLSRLPFAEYQAARKEAAAALGFGVTALDRVVKAEKAKRGAAAAAADRARPPPAAGETRWPMGFSMQPDGLYVDTGGDDPPIWICPPFRVLGQGRDATGEGWGLWLEWADGDGRLHRWAMPNRLLMVGPGELEGELVDRGLRVSADGAARAMLRRALSEVKSGNRVTTVDRPGWHGLDAGGVSYVLPDGTVIGHAGEDVVLRSMPEAAAQMVAVKGTLAGWKKDVARLAEGNPVPAFVLASGFAGLVLDAVGETSGGFHLKGPSKCGKTLVARLAVSVLGAPSKGGILRDWRATANGLEMAAEDANDSLLVLDEIHQADAREVVGAVYMLGNEAGKSRARRNITSAKRKVWRTFILSTGEVEVAAMAAKAGQPLPAGADVRLPSLHVDAASMWPELHGSADARALMAHLHGAVRREHGTAGREFVRRLAALRCTDPDQLDGGASAMRSRFAKMLPDSASQQVHDVARRCALVAYAGELAIEWGILPWRQDGAVTACRAVLDRWLGRRGNAGAAEEATHVRVVRLFLVAHGASRFVELRKNDGGGWEEAHPNRTVINRAGWRRPTDDGRDEYLIDRDVFRELCVVSGIDVLEAARTLLGAGHLAKGEGKNLAKRETVPGLGRPRVYVVHGTLLDGEDAEGKAASS